MADLMCGCGKCGTCLGRGPEHTAGPWFVGVMNDALFVIDRPPAHFTDNPLPEGGPTVVIASVSMLTHPTAQANANVLAAAPELLESLKTIMDGFEEGIFVRNISGDEKGDWALRLIPFIAALGKAQAAIEKAEPKGHYS